MKKMKRVKNWKIWRGGGKNFEKIKVKFWKSEEGMRKKLFTRIMLFKNMRSKKFLKKAEGGSKFFLTGTPFEPPKRIRARYDALKRIEIYLVCILVIQALFFAFRIIKALGYIN